MNVFQRNVVDEAGNVIPLAEIEVFFAGTSSKPDLFSDDQSTPLTNPFSADSSGFFRFYVAGGAYDIAVNSSVRWENIRLGSMSSQDADDVVITGGDVTLTSPLKTSAGSAAAPALTKTGDTDTGLFYPADNVLAVSTGGSERVRVSSTGLSIGTTTQQDPVTIKASSSTTGFRLINSADANIGARIIPGELMLYSDSSVLTASIKASGNSYIGTGTSARIGIGTASPLHSVDVGAGNSAGTGAGGSDHEGGIRVRYSTGFGLSMECWDSAAPRWGIFRWNGTTPHVLFEGVASSSVVHLNGSLGIGTTSATSQLDVSGNSIRIRASSTPASASATGSAGEIRWDADYIYVCTATDTWKRAALSTW
jgi:hypothetical protein